MKNKTKKRRRYTCGQNRKPFAHPLGKCLLYLLIYGYLLPPGFGQIDSLLQVLDRQISMRPDVLQKKYQQLQTLRQELGQAREQKDSFQLLLQLTREYQSFNYDTAYREVQRLKKAAFTEQEKVQALIRESFILLSSGLFREAIAELEVLNPEKSPDSIRSMYHFNLARSYFDLSDAYTGYLDNEAEYEAGIRSLEAAIAFAEPNSVPALSYRALLALKRNEQYTSKPLYLKLIRHPGISTRQLAIEYSALSSLYENTQPDSAVIYMIRAAIADETTLVRESTALTYLAQYLSEAEDFERASRYINLALADANFFGAQHRKMQILNILPLIERQRLELEQSKYRQFVFFSGTLTVLLLFSVYLIFRTLRQKRHIDRQNQQINAQNRQLTANEAAIRKAYHQLEEYAQKLIESDQLKEQYIGHFFQSNTNLVNKVSALFKKALQQVHEGKFKEAIYTLRQFNKDYEQKKLLQDFDSIFLTVFPTFIQQINQFFPASEQFELPEDKVLSTELRIFAIMRLGISNNHTIARVHEHSVNTIYAYKTKVRNKSSLSNEEFDKAILRIRSIWDKEGDAV